MVVLLKSAFLYCISLARFLQVCHVALWLYYGRTMKWEHGQHMAKQGLQSYACTLTPS
jgi:hypothetical protein